MKRPSFGVVTGQGDRNLKVLAIFATLLTASGAQAAWRIAPTFTLSTTYEDNVRLNEHNEDDGTVTVTTAQVRVSNTTERSGVAADAGVNYRWYSGVDNMEDKDSQFLNLAAGRRSGERSRISLRGAYTRDTLMRSVRFVPDIDDPDDVPPGTDDPVDVDEGQSRQQIRRIHYQVSPSWTYRFSERTSGTFGYTYSERQHKGAQPGFVAVRDSTTQAITADVRHQFSPVDTLGVSVQATEFDPDNRVESDIVEVQTGWTRLLSEVTTVEFGIGARRVGSNIDEETGMLYRASVKRRLNSGSLSARLERSLYPSSFGEIVETDRVFLRYRQQLSERWSLRTSVYAMSTESSVGTNSLRHQDFARAKVSAQYNLYPGVKLGLNYGYTWVDRKSNAHSTSRNSIGLSVSYRQ